MALYDGVASIRLEGDKEKALALVPEGKLLLSKVQEIAKKTGASTFSMTQRVDDDSYIYALTANGINVIFISSNPVYTDLVTEEEEEDKDGKLDFLSGIVVDGAIEERTETAPDGTEITYKILRKWAPTQECARKQKINTGYQESKRLAVLPKEFLEATNLSDSEEQYSQYHELRPSMWTGIMKKVIQVIMGYGKLKTQQLVHKKARKYETQQLDHKKAREYKTYGVQIKYDYKFSRTHGIYKGPDDTLWLIEISQTRGVLAMPLPKFPGYNRKQSTMYRENGNNAMATVLEELGCLPSGETFPTGQKLEEKIQRGDILRLLTADDLSVFYQEAGGFSSACGWAFSDTGNEAHNISYICPEKTLCKARWYKIIIDIGAINRHRMENEPIAAGSANIIKCEENYIYNRAIVNQYYYRDLFSEYGFTYYEPLVLSNIRLPDININSNKITLPKESIETTVFVAFINGELHTAKLFIPNTEFGASSDSYTQYYSTEDTKGSISELPMPTITTTYLSFDRTYKAASLLRLELVYYEFESGGDIAFTYFILHEDKSGSGFQSQVINIPRYHRSAYYLTNTKTSDWHFWRMEFWYGFPIGVWFYDAYVGSPPYGLSVQIGKYKYGIFSSPGPARADDFEDVTGYPSKEIMEKWLTLGSRIWIDESGNRIIFTPCNFYFYYSEVDLERCVYIQTGKIFRRIEYYRQTGKSVFEVIKPSERKHYFVCDGLDSIVEIDAHRDDGLLPFDEPCLRTPEKYPKILTTLEEHRYPRFTYYNDTYFLPYGLSIGAVSSCLGDKCFVLETRPSKIVLFKDLFVKLNYMKTPTKNGGNLDLTWLRLPHNKIVLGTLPETVTSEDELPTFIGVNGP